MASRKNFKSSSTAITKLVQTAGKFGNTGIKSQQFTHRHIYHYLPFDGKTSLPFFENVNTARPLFSNIQVNQLQVGEVMIIKELFFDIISETVTDPVSNPPRLSASTNFTAAAVPGMYNSQFSWLNDNNRVVKPIGLQEMNPMFNKKAFNENLNVITLESEITIQPLISFIGQLNTPSYTAVANVYIGCHVLGIGTILAPKTTY